MDSMKRRLFDASVPPERAKSLPADTLNENATLTKAARNMSTPRIIRGRQLLTGALVFLTFGSSTGFWAWVSVGSVVFLRI